jgi:hypothetical protein
MNPDPGGSKTYGSGSATLLSCVLIWIDSSKIPIWTRSEKKVRIQNTFTTVYLQRDSGLFDESMLEVSLRQTQVVKKIAGQGKANKAKKKPKK